MSAKIGLWLKINKAMAKINRNCDNCGESYLADTRDLSRGWGKCCSKSCAASLREKSRSGYNRERVKRNNIRRVLWNENLIYQGSNETRREYEENYDPGDSEYWENSDNGTFM